MVWKGGEEMNIPDNYDQWLHHEWQQERRLADLPKCGVCGNPIQDDHYYEIDGENICPECLDNHFRKDVDLYE